LAITKLKKKKELLEQYQEKFINGCINNDIDKSYAENLWNDILGFADYCLAGDTKISCKIPLFGSPGFHEYITIKEIVEQKDQVFVQNSNGNWVLATQFHYRGEQQTFTYTLEDGRTITCTPDHKFMTENGTMVSIQEAMDNGLDLKLN
jgi:DNA polymerase-3 subunit alpha